MHARSSAFAENCITLLVGLGGASLADQNMLNSKAPLLLQHGVEGRSRDAVKGFGMVIRAISTGFSLFQGRRDYKQRGRQAAWQKGGTRQDVNTPVGRNTAFRRQLAVFRTRASIVFPVPGTPLKSMPRGALTPCRYASLEHASVT